MMIQTDKKNSVIAPPYKVMDVISRLYLLRKTTHLYNSNSLIIICSLTNLLSLCSLIH